MKRLLLFITTLCLVSFAHAQFVYNDFDANQNVPFVGGAPDPTIIANPYPGGINTSPNVAEWVREGWEWSHAKAPLDGFIDFSTGTTFTMKVYSPKSTTVVFKLEGIIGPIEVSQPVTAGSWQELSFDFPTAPNDSYNTIVIFFDIATFNTDTYYFDDVEGPEYTAAPEATLTLPVTFDDPDADYNLVDFGGALSQIIIDPDDADNNIVETIKTETAESWAGTTVGGSLGFADPIPFTVDSTLMGVVVWSPDEGIPVRLKVEDASNSGITCETEAITSVAMAWDTLVFDFNNPAPGTAALNVNNTYNKASMFFNFGTTGADAGEKTYYWDYMFFAGAPEPKPLMELNVQDNFEDDGWGTIDAWFFQDPDMFDMVTTTDPIDSENTVADYNRTGNFPYTNAQFVMEHRMDLTERNKFEMDVYFPSSNDYSGALTTGAAIKLQNSKMGGNAWMTQTEIVITVNDLDEWVTLLFDFSAIADSVNYDQVVVQLGGEGHSVPAQFYFDNLYLKHVPYVTIMTPNGGEEIEQNSSYTIEWDYNYWDGDINIELLKEGSNPEPVGLDVAAADSVFEWNVFPDQEPGEDYRIIITSINDPIITDTSDTYFTIMEVDGVQSNFSADITLLTVGNGVSFTDMSSGGPDTWEWVFEGGMPATYDGQNPPEIIYNEDGVFDVTLTVYIGENQDIMIKEDYITVGVPPAADFEASLTQILAGQSVDFTNFSDGEENTYQWIFDGGNPSTSEEMNPAGIVYEEVGAFDVTLIAVNMFGSDTLIMPGYIKVTPVGLNDNLNKLIKVYPNPVTDQLHISLPSEKIYDLGLFDMNGQRVISVKSENGLVNLNTNSLNAGLYLLRIVDNDGGELVLHKILIH